MLEEMDLLQLNEIFQVTYQLAKELGPQTPDFQISSLFTVLLYGTLPDQY